MLWVCCCCLFACFNQALNNATHAYTCVSLYKKYLSHLWVWNILPFLLRLRAWIFTKGGKEKKVYFTWSLHKHLSFAGDINTKWVKGVMVAPDAHSDIRDWLGNAQAWWKQWSEETFFIPSQYLLLGQQNIVLQLLMPVAFVSSLRVVHLKWALDTSDSCFSVFFFTVPDA